MVNYISMVVLVAIGILWVVLAFYDPSPKHEQEAERIITFHIFEQKIDWVYAADTLPELPEVSVIGYVFAGWYVDERCTVPCNEQNCMIATDLHAKLQKI